VKIVKTVIATQATIVPTFQVRGMALLLFEVSGDELDLAEEEDAAAVEAEDPLDGEMLDVADEAGGDAALGAAAGVDGVWVGDEGVDRSEFAAAAGEGDADVGGAVVVCWGCTGSADEGGLLGNAEGAESPLADGPEIVNGGLRFPESPNTVEEHNKP
jgi:hypothetical protein